MPERAINAVIEATKTTTAVGGVNAPLIAPIINALWISENGIFNITFDVWLAMLSAVYILHQLGLFRSIRWAYNKIRGHDNADSKQS